MAKFMCITLALCAVASASPIIPGLEGIPGVNLLSGLTFQGSAASSDLLKGLPVGRSALSGVLSNVPVAGGLLGRERRDVDVKLDAGLGINGGLDVSNLVGRSADGVAAIGKTAANLANAAVNTGIGAVRTTGNTAVNAARAAAESAGPIGQQISTGMGIAQGLFNTGLSVLSGLENAKTSLINAGLDAANQLVNPTGPVGGGLVFSNSGNVASVPTAGLNFALAVPVRQNLFRAL